MFRYGMNGYKGHLGMLQSRLPSTYWPMQSQHLARMALLRVSLLPDRCLSRALLPGVLGGLRIVVALLVPDSIPEVIDLLGYRDSYQPSVVLQPIAGKLAVRSRHCVPGNHPHRVHDLTYSYCMVTLIDHIDPSG